MFEITEGIYASINEFNGKKFLDIRKWYKDKSGELKPTRKGINLNKEEWENFIANFDNIKSFAKSI